MDGTTTTANPTVEMDGRGPSDSTSASTVLSLDPDAGHTPLQTFGVATGFGPEQVDLLTRLLDSRDARLRDAIRQDTRDRVAWTMEVPTGWHQATTHFTMKVSRAAHARASVSFRDIRDIL